MATEQIAERTELPADSLWDLGPLYPDAEDWEQDLERLETLTAEAETYRGRLEDADTALAFFRLGDELGRLAEKLYVYAHLRADEDTRDSAAQAREQRMRQTLAAISARLAWEEPELLALPEGTLEDWRGRPGFEPYRYPLKKLIRRRPHTLSDKEETLLSRTSEVLESPAQIFSMLNDADLTFPPVTDSAGRERELSQGRFLTFLQDPDRAVRRQAFEKVYDQYGAHRHTLAATLSSMVREHCIMAEIRGYESARHAALHGDAIPEALYDTLIDATHEALPQYRRYLDLRAGRLGLETLDMYDLYLPLVPEQDDEIPFEQARDWVIAACRPLGEEYGAILRQAFDERWIDVYENRGKRSGAYSSGCYDGPPYVLMNYQGTLEDVFTLAHELGHAMHTRLANRAQPPSTARYTIFIAEIASTLNEALLCRHLLAEEGDPAFRARVLNHLCDAFKGTVYRQTMFAEFERDIHTRSQRGEILTADALSRQYGALNARFHAAPVDPDDRIALEWARIPHFYYNFYVYKYATSYCASQILARQILDGEDGALERTLDLWRAGGSDDSLTLLRRAGVDLTDRRTMVRAFDGFADTVAELEQTLQAVR